MRRYGNMVGMLLAGLAALLGAALLLRLAWNWMLPEVFGFGPILLRHVLGVALVGLVAAGLAGLLRQRGNRFIWRG
jgi:hypothetical protein